MKLKLLIITFCLVCSTCILAQDSIPKINVTADVMSRYIWRGADYGNAPSIQPTLSYTNGGFEIGIWNSFSTTGSYAENDPYIKYTFKNVSIALTDYFIPCLANTTSHELCPFISNNFFDYKDNNTFKMDSVTNMFSGKTTCHTLEASVQYKGPDKFPFSILVATYIYGNDKKIKDTVFYDAAKSKITQVDLKNQFSTYIELGYTFKCHGNNFDTFLGFTPFAGAYGNGMGVVNIGLTGYRTIKVTNDFSLPLKASVITNPQASKIFFVFGFTL